jgi:glycosyltransferase involved in cell wall biosynthesis
MPTPRLLIATRYDRSVAKIHTDLARALAPEYRCDVLDWAEPLHESDVTALLAHYSAVLTTTEGADYLHHVYSVPYSRCIAVACDSWDIPTMCAAADMQATDFDALLGYAVVSDKLADVAFARGITRVPAILPIGVWADEYVRAPAIDVRTLGYFNYTAGQIDSETLAAEQRPHLAAQVAEAAGLELVTKTDAHFLATPELYKSVDVVLFCSLLEGTPLQALEAMAAGVPVLGPPAGAFAVLACTGGGGVLPYEPEKLVQEAVEVLRALQDNPELYAQMSVAASAVGALYDWSKVKSIWLEYLQTVLTA